MSIYAIDVVDGYVQPTTPIDTNEGYVNMVMNMAAQSYMHQYKTANVEDGITAAREAFNASLPQPEPTPEPEQEP
jgi:hypothetical protein